MHCLQWVAEIAGTLSRRSGVKDARVHPDLRGDGDGDGDGGGEGEENIT